MFRLQTRPSAWRPRVDFIIVAFQVEAWSGIVEHVLTRKCRSPAIAVV